VDIAVRLLNGLLMIAMPIVLGIYLARRMGQRWKLFLVGAALFVASQVLHIPFNLIVLNPILEQIGFGQAGFGAALLLGALLLGLSAGLFEEITRWLGLRYWVKEARSWSSSLMYGAGWGGMEAILVGLAVMWGLSQALLWEQGLLQSLIPADQLALVDEQFAAYWDTPLLLNLLGAAERSFALMLHLSLSVMVMRVFTHNNRLWLVAAIAWHALVDAIAVVAITQISVVATEAIVAVLGGISLAIIFLLKESDPVPAEKLRAPTTEFEPKPVQVTEEKLDGSRYSS